MVLSVAFSVYGFSRKARTSSGVNVFPFIVIPPICRIIMISSVATLSPSGLRFFHRSCTAFGIHTIPLSTVWVSYFLTVQTLGFTQLECPLLGVHFSHCSGKRTITPYKKTNTQLKNDYPDKRTISKHKATARRPFGGRKSVGRNKSLVVFLSKKFRKHRHNPKNWQKERTQSSIRFVSMIASLFGAGGRTRTGTPSLAVDFESTTSTNSITPA